MQHHGGTDRYTDRQTDRQADKRKIVTSTSRITIFLYSAFLMFGHRVLSKLCDIRYYFYYVRKVSIVSIKISVIRRRDICHKHVFRLTDDKFVLSWPSLSV
jgi:hypothetical protein